MEIKPPKPSEYELKLAGEIRESFMSELLDGKLFDKTSTDTKANWIIAQALASYRQELAEVARGYIFRDPGNTWMAPLDQMRIAKSIEQYGGKNEA